MYYKIIQPSAILSQFIKHYWIMETDAYEGDVCERVIPTGSIQLMFHYKKPFVVKNINNKSLTQPRSIISGINNTFFDVSTHGEAGVIAVSFLPSGACNFFRFPMSEIENQSFDLCDILNKKIKQVEEQVCLAKNIGERILIIEHFLREQLSPVKHHDYKLIQQAINLINQHQGQANILELSEKLSVTSKNLERKFSSLVGKTPKQYSKLVRFQSVILDMSRNPDSSLTELAYKNGYFDQSHFIKDFKLYSGYTPGDFWLNCSCDHLETDFGF